MFSVSEGSQIEIYLNIKIKQLYLALLETMSKLIENVIFPEIILKFHVIFCKNNTIIDSSPDSNPFSKTYKKEEKIPFIICCHYQSPYLVSK